MLSTLSPQGLNAFRGMLIADPEKALQWMLQQEGALATRQTRTVSADGRVRELLPDGGLGRDYGAANDGPPPRTVTADGRVRELLPDGSLGRDYGAASDRDNKVFERERELRNDLNKRLETFNIAESNFRRMATLYRPEGMTGAQDIGLVYSYMKMLDPGSVVREGEAASANNAAGVPEAVRAMYNRLIGGGTLSDAARAQMIGAAQQVYGAERGTAERVREQFRTIAPQYEGLNADRVAPPLRDAPRITQVQPPPRPPTGFTARDFGQMSEAQLVAVGDSVANLTPAEKAALAMEVNKRLRAAGIR